MIIAGLATIMCVDNIHFSMSAHKTFLHWCRISLLLSILLVIFVTFMNQTDRLDAVPPIARFADAVQGFAIISILFLGSLLFLLGFMQYVYRLIENKKENTALPLQFMFFGVISIVGMILCWGIIGYTNKSISIQSSSGKGGIMLAVNPTQPHHLLGASHNVFIGKVLAQSGVTDSATGPRTQYSLQVLHNIKGNLAGTISIEQEGGTIGEMQYLIEDAFPPLTPDSTYLLATRYNVLNGAYTVLAHKSAVKLLSIEHGMNSDASMLQFMADTHVLELEFSYPNEVLLPADLANNRTLNSFHSLPEDKKAEALERAREAKVMLDQKPSHTEIQ